ncbi:ABC-type nitrate/sulfonate/bicarbonate transport system, permease component [Cenarchaeum symbiosum A]|uniref:ABC-type nitrate/sulfonate/bicarbonate transport system, permease component n=1 Tax=Cenarchaeum symbiosum (strain A) TaxID=414004 RepID=A0RW46_CENSY|nr:ABC-type nitrate/sulfonate/bicarbonate transport system, permease component [Cenarchaeum symbiosum A]
MKGISKVRARRLLFYTSLIVAWQAAASAGAWPPEVFPSPYEVGEDLAYGAADGSLVYGLATSLWRLIVGLSAAIAGGVVLGVLMARVPAVDQTIGSLVLGLQSIPSIAWVPLALIWFGPFDAGIIFVTAVGAVFAVTINTYTGVKNIDPHYVEAARNMGARGGRLVTDVIIPAAFPYMISGFKQGWAFAWRGVIGAEILFSFLGLGFLLHVGRFTSDVSQVISVMLVIMAVGMAVDGLVFRRLEDRVRLRWGLG